MNDKEISLTELRKYLDSLGYDLHLNKFDVMKKKHKYCTSNKKCGGGINYFDDKNKLFQWIKDVQEVRSLI
jgi:hypothetical protein